MRKYRVRRFVIEESVIEAKNKEEALRVFDKHGPFEINHRRTNVTRMTDSTGAP